MKQTNTSNTLKGAPFSKWKDASKLSFFRAVQKRLHPLMIPLMRFTLWGSKTRSFIYSKQEGIMRNGNVEFSYTGNKICYDGKLDRYVHFLLSIKFFGRTFIYDTDGYFTKDPVCKVRGRFKKRRYSVFLRSLLEEAKAHPERFYMI